VTHKRFVDMGHTFSPLIESATDFETSHGEAVAIDLALSAALATVMGWLPGAECVRLVRTLARCGLRVRSQVLTQRLCLDALDEARRHRRHLVLPTSIGRAAFVEDARECSAAALAAALDALETLESDPGDVEPAQAMNAHA